MFVMIGASSFIGVYTAVHFLNRGEQIIVTGRNGKFKDYYDKIGARYVELDLTNEKDFERLPTKDVEGVILISGMLPASENADLKNIENADQYIKVNTLGTICVLEYCRKNKIKRLINTMSYADVANLLTMSPAMDESLPRDFKFTGDHAVYVISKNAAADIMEYYNQQHDMKNVWFRLPPVYGVGPHGHLKVNGKVVKSGLQIFIDKAKKGEEIEVYGNLARDVVYVKDVADAYYLAAKSGNAQGLYNITSGRATTLLEQAEVCADIFARDREHRSRIHYREDILNRGKSYLFSIDKAKKEFGYDPKFVRFRDMMSDYKYELGRGVYTRLFQDREV